MIARDELVTYCNELLDVNSFADYCPNGLQIEGKSEIIRLVAGVTASRALVEKAIACNADAILVHHGYFWRGEDARLVGMKRERIALLLRHQINLLAYHLPLDAHPEYGNNIGLARALGFDECSPLPNADTPGLLWYADFSEPIDALELSRRIGSALDRTPLHVSGGSKQIHCAVWCTGGAQHYIETAADFGADAYITGEASEQTTHIARERGLHFFAAGHHATERFGAQSLASHLNNRFGLDTRFVDIPNPV